ncbi:hypothetical protein LLEC1_03255 [Akanthomyces lecanii]|uniref:SRR1-like domain-containing protein n=1 Tax=Cordyceps confragosa TaxID=2714763 RepID=A0A179IGF4_CORDF|nr:hypothetical protein LLEC1_03255 [Akanthomyces lecanii]
MAAAIKIILQQSHVSRFFRAEILPLTHPAEFNSGVRIKRFNPIPSCKPSSSPNPDTRAIQNSNPSHQRISQSTSSSSFLLIALAMSELSSSPRKEMLRRLEAAASQLAIQHQDSEHMIQRIAESKELVKDYIDAYEQGKPFWSRDVIADLDRQIDALVQAGDARDVDAVVTVEDVMTHMSSKFPESMMHLESPMSIVYGSKPEASGWPLADLEAAFRVHQAAWQQSTACRSLVDILNASDTTAIRKIVCFGLGRLDDWTKTTRETLATSVERAAVQHAAALTMAETLTAKQDREVKAGGVVRCYTQEPAYADTEKALLAKLSFTVLEDPKGFLEVDEHTLVFSVIPNVPVRQIVTDMASPAAMVWNEIEEDRACEAQKDYRMEMKWGEEMRISPWLTDEGSTRVTEMGKHYRHFSLPGDPFDQDMFGLVGIYLKK